VGDYTAISTAVKESYDWRPIDVLINNAGITRSGFMEDFSVEDINTVVQTNLLGSIYPVHAILPQLKLRSRDHPISIVFIGSLASLVRRLYLKNVLSLSKRMRFIDFKHLNVYRVIVRSQQPLRALWIDS
jgi:NADP-dependent 3-hydroxy acid dehydrogenase YdfG